jgi:hypothetical protein
MLLNFSNHPSSQWPEKQMNEAVRLFKNVIDLEFPQISPYASEQDIINLSNQYLSQIIEIKNLHTHLAVHIMGEFTFTYRMIYLLHQHNIPCYASTTERTTTEHIENNIVKKSTIFNFVKFRRYM